MSGPARLRVRPLLVRSDARFECFVDGICCTDIHRLGPLARADVRRLELLGADAVVSPTEGAGPELRFTDDGRCTLLDGARCSIHAEHGAAEKPSICRHFPLGLIATPLGGRVVTAHRCPCRTMGERRLLSPAAAEGSLASVGGRITADRRAPLRIPVTSRTTISFASWVELEAALIACLVAGDPPEVVLEIGRGLPALRGSSWREIAAAFVAFGAHPRRGHRALGWFGDGVLLALGEQPAPRERPWSDGFDRAEARSPSPAPPTRIIGDWLADLIWDLSWTDHGAFDRARASIAALSVIAFAVTARLIELGARADRAAAEALLVAEIGAGHPLWAASVARLETAPPWMTRRRDP
ncbi:MAG: hypothetical protein ABJE95_04100 [Byssovorax sp.]